MTDQMARGFGDSRAKIADSRAVWFHLNNVDHEYLFTRTSEDCCDMRMQSKSAEWASTEKLNET